LKLSIHISLESHDGSRGFEPLAVHSSKTNRKASRCRTGLCVVALIGGNSKLKGKLHLYSSEAAASPTSPAKFLASQLCLYNTTR